MHACIGTTPRRGRGPVVAEETGSVERCQDLAEELARYGGERENDHGKLEHRRLEWIWPYANETP